MKQTVYKEEEEKILEVIMVIKKSRHFLHHFMFLQCLYHSTEKEWRETGRRSGRMGARNLLGKDAKAGLSR
jgi:hypothetical protein